MDTTIIAISLMVLLMSGYLYRVASGEPVWRVNMLTYSFYLLVALCFVSSVVIMLDIPFLNFDPRDNPIVFGDWNRRLMVWGIAMWSLIGIPLGAIFVNIFFYRSSSIIGATRDFRQLRCTIGWGLTPGSLYRITGAASILLMIFFLCTMPKETPLFHVLGGGNVVEGQIIRHDFSFGFQNSILKGLFNEGSLIFLSLISLTMSYQTRRRGWWILFVTQFLSVFYLSVLKGTVGHILFYFIALAFCRALNKGKFIRFHEVVLLCLLTTALFIMFKGAEGSFLKILASNVLNRVFFGQLHGAYYALEIFPDIHNFLWFSSSGHWLNELLTGTSSESYGVVMMGYYNPQGVTAGSAGHLTSYFMTEAWANFGMLGVIFAPVWVGMFVQFVNRWFLNRHKSVILITFYVYLATMSFGYATDFVSFYYPAGTVLFIVGVSSILGAGRFLQQTLRNKKKKTIRSVALG